MYKKDYKYKIGDEFVSNKTNYRIIDRYVKKQRRKVEKNEYVKKYIIHCNVCNTDKISLRESQISKGVGCHVVVIK